MTPQDRSIADFAFARFWNAVKHAHELSIVADPLSIKWMVCKQKSSALSFTVTYEYPLTDAERFAW